MGHYRAEMVSDEPSKPYKDPDLDMWIVDDSYNAIKIRDFDKLNHGQFSPIFYRFKREKFDSKKKAKAHALQLLHKAYENLKKDEIRLLALIRERE